IRHRCCHRTTRIYDTGAQPYHKTEYGEKYPGYGSVCPPESCRPSAQLRPDHGTMNSTSTFKSDYIPHEVKLPSRTQPEYRPKSGDIDLGTVYRRDYSPHKVGPVVLARPRESRHTTGARLDTIPTYRGNDTCHLHKESKPT
uniref:Uncharacterized protein n=1 Tax=Malurus cyaneus samueli TaxID=2593467 RepID=A0A8C5TR32_9PASS